MRNPTVLVLVAIAALCANSFAVDPTPPKWPSKYTIHGNFYLPLAAPGPLVEPVMTSMDSEKGHVMFDYYHGLDKTVFKYDTNEAWLVEPRIDKQVCYFGRAGAKPTTLPTVLPDLSNWKYGGKGSFGHHDTYIFTTTVASPAPSNFTSVYKFHINQRNGHPVFFEMKGHNMIWGAHPDAYAFEYLAYNPHHVAEEEFQVPHLCHNKDAVEIDDRKMYRVKMRLGRVNYLHPVMSDDPYEHYARAHQKVYGVDEVEYRRSLFKKNSEFIDEYNKDPNNPTQLKINHFADLTTEERKALFGNNARRQVDDGATHTHVFDPKESLPDSIDWRSKGAVTRVKDQGVCGSCWTFGAAASLEGAYYVKYKKLISLSEQNILDCSFNNGDMACDGGTAYNAYAWLMSTGGLESEEEYPYRMQSDYCRLDASGVKITGYVNVTMGDEQALKSAVAKMPVTVAINTDDPVWYYHTGSGVYNSKNCPGGLNDLDHQVTVVGYGTQDGQDYWLVKNSYSEFWGDHGYIKMARNAGNLCGIATQPNYPIVA